VKIGDWVYSREQLISTLWVDVIYGQTIERFSIAGATSLKKN